MEQILQQILSKLNEIESTMATKSELEEVKRTIEGLEKRLEINKRLDLHLARISKLEEEVALIK